MSLPGLNEPFPSRDAIVDERGYATPRFTRWNEEGLLARVDRAPARVQAAEQLTGKSATTSGTLGGDQTAGLYQVTYVANVVTDEAAATLELTLTWTYGGQTRSHVFTPMDGSIVANEQGIVYPVQIDPGTPISYTLTYVGATFTYDATLSAALLEAIG